MNTLPMTIEAENFDYDPVSGEGRIYHDKDGVNTGSKYRLDEGVDIDTCSEGGYQLTALEDGEWLSYTIAAPSSALYEISINYASANANGKIKFSVAGEDITDEISVPFGGDNSNGINDWKDFVITDDVILKQGVQALTIHISGESNAFVLNNFTITPSDENACDDGWVNVSAPSNLIQGINYSYYEGTWDSLPDFSQLTPIESGIADSIGFNEAWADDNFGVVYSGYIDIPVDGMYTFYTSSNEGSRLYLDENLLVDNDGIHSETEVSGSACLYSGYHTIRVEYFETTGEEGLLVQFEGPGTSKRVLNDYLKTTDPFGRIEAEDYDQANGTNTEDCSDTGGGQNVGSIRDGNWLMFSNINLSEVHSINMRLASKSSGGTIEVRLGSASGTLVSTLDMPNTGNWQGWETVSGALTSEAGIYDVYLVFKSSSSYVGNINWIEFSGTVIDETSVDKVEGVQNISLYPNPVKDKLTITNSNGAHLQVYNQLGRMVIEEIIKSDQYKVSMTDLQSGFYVLRVANDGVLKNYKVIKE